MESIDDHPREGSDGDSTDGPARAESKTWTPARPELAAEGIERARVRAEVLRRLVGSDDDDDDDSNRIGRFRLERKLGEGGMGVVYVAHDDELDRQVAIKLLRHDDRPTRRARMLREAQALAKLSHPNVVAVYDVGTHDGQVFIAMEYVQGQTLRRWVQAESRSVAEIVGMYARAGEGLAAAHDAALVHRDFKPDNVIVGDDGRPRVLDFGLARSGARDDDEPAEPTAPLAKPRLDTPLTQTGITLGTPAYMAPEQFALDPTDARTDQFAFCVSLYEALFGTRPFEGETRYRLATNVMEGNLRPRPKGTRVPAWLQPLVERGLAVDPDQRHPSMRALLDAMNRGARRARLRRGGFVMLGLGALVAGGFGLRALDHQRRVDGCVAEGVQARRVWSSEVRTEAEQSLLATEAHGAQATVERALPKIDVYADELREVATEVCSRARVDRSWSEDLYARARWCLDERRQRLDALAASLSEPTSNTVERAVQTVARLQPLSVCTDTARLQRLPLPPLAQRARVAEVRAQIARASTAAHLGEYATSAEIAAAARDAATAIPWPPAAAEAGLWIGHAKVRTGDIAGSERILEEAYFEAARADAPRVAFDLANRLAWTTGTAGGRNEDGMRWARLADVQRTKLPDPLGILRASHHEVIAHLHFADGRWSEAQREFEIAIGILKPLVGEQSMKVVTMLARSGTAAAQQGQLAKAEQILRRALELTRAELGADHPGTATILGELGNLAYMRGDLTSARADMEDTLRVFRATRGPNSPETAAAMANLGTLELSAGNVDAAQSRLESALEIYERAHGPEHRHVATALDNLANLYNVKGEPAKAVEHRQRALTIYENLHEEGNLETARVMAHVAGDHRRAGDLAKAREYGERALAMTEAVGGPDDLLVANVSLGLAMTAQADGRHDDAITLASRAVRVREHAEGRPDELASARFFLATALARQGRDLGRAVALAKKVRDFELTRSEPDTAELDAFIAKHGG